jgi:hypothetical protein
MEEDLKKKIQGQHMFKVHVLHEKSIQVVYQNRVSDYLMSIPTNMETNEDWKNIKLCIHKSRI